MKQLLNKILIIIATLGVFSAPLVSVPVYAQTPKDEICKGVGATGASCTSSGSTVEGTVASVIKILSWAVGIASVIMVIVGGFKYIISSGDSNNINSAKNTILYALVGLVVVALAQVIVIFVLDKST